MENLLIGTNIREDGFPAFMGGLFSLCNSHECRVVKTMFSAKSLDPMHRICISTWRSYYEDFLFRCMCFRTMFLTLFTSNHISNSIRAFLFTQTSKTHLFLCFWFMCFAQPGANTNVRCTDLCTSLKSMGITLTRKTPFLFSRFASRCSIFSYFAQFSPGFGRILNSQCGTSDSSYIEPFIAKRQKRIKIILLTWYQHFRKHDVFHHIKSKNIRSVLIPSTLQFDVVMISTPKSLVMSSAPITQINGTTNIKPLIGNTRDAIYARDGGDRFMVECGHSCMDLLDRFFSLGFMGASNTCKAEQYVPSLYHSTRSLSTSKGCFMADIVVKFNHFDDISKKLQTALKQTVKKTAMDIQAVAAIQAPKDTGFLANSIYTVTNSGSSYGKVTGLSPSGKRRTKKVDTTSMLSQVPPPPDGYTAYVVVGASYGIFVEMGHHTRSGSYVPAQPYLAPAVDFVQPIFEAALGAIESQLGGN